MNHTSISSKKLESSELWGQFYTSDIFSQTLIRNLEVNSPDFALELGPGEGGLINALINRWSNTQVITIDIDKRNHDYLNKQWPQHTHVNADVLSIDIKRVLQPFANTVSLAICNPPFVRIPWLDSYGGIMEEIGVPLLEIERKISSDIIFFAQNLKMLSKLGELAIILPNGFLTSQKYQYIRRYIINSHKIKKILQLPQRIYKGTDAATHIMYLEKEAECGEKVKLGLVDLSGKVEDMIEVQTSCLEHRMDYNFYSIRRKKIKKLKFVSLGSIASIKRGTINNTAAKGGMINLFHTTDFKNNSNLESISLTESLEANDAKYIVAKSGDIVIARIGRNLEAQVAYISEGQSIISDCIFRIRFDSKYGDAIWQSLTSSEGKGILSSMAYGVCAKSISKYDLAQFPIIIRNV